MKVQHYLISTAGIIFLITVTLYISGYYSRQAMMSYARNGDLNTFDDLMTMSTKYNPFNPNRAMTKAEIYLENNEPLKALGELKWAIKMEPYNRNVHLLLGKTLTVLGQNDRAEKAFRQAIKYAPAQDLEAYVYLVNLLQKTGQIEEARTIARAGLAYFPESVFESSLWTNYNKGEVVVHKLLLTAYLENSH